VQGGQDNCRRRRGCLRQRGWLGLWLGLRHGLLIHSLLGRQRLGLRRGLGERRAPSRIRCQQPILCLMMTGFYS
jgi:hypothetical protein